jgi:CRISPR/Cas system-associated exonuclease Cas4 (RecB family)
MSSFTEKQNLFIDYLLRRIGFKNQELINRYKGYLDGEHTRIYQEAAYSNNYTPGRYTPTVYYNRVSNSECIEVLLKEIDIKKNIPGIERLNTKLTSILSATDISSFVFCPASYSINKTFKIEYPTKVNRINIGTDFHESLRLAKRKAPEGFTPENHTSPDVRNDRVVNKVRNCELIYAGHDNGYSSGFTNTEERFNGNPDYIFKDPLGRFFVVEEKFRYLNDYISDSLPEEVIEDTKRYRRIVKNTFHSNHIMQLVSYMKFIKEYELGYGVLVYWFYSLKNNKPYIHSVSTKVLKLEEHKASLEKYLARIKNFVETGQAEFGNQVNPSKCVSCSVTKYCSHKTNEFRKLEFPYNPFDLTLKYAEFPNGLKKEKKESDDKSREYTSDLPF